MTFQGREREKKKASDSKGGKNSASDEDIQKLLDYFGLGEYTGLIPILRKLGSDKTTLAVFSPCGTTLVHASA